MYSEFYGLLENPFSISPDPKYFYLSERHNQAFAHGSHGLKSGGAFVLLTGELGTGKTTVSRRLLNILPKDTNLAIIYHPTDEARDLYACICDEFCIEYEKDASIKELFDLLKKFLFNKLENGHSSVIVVDEAQMLSEDSLEQLRLLTNLETDNRKVVQIVLIGQPELQEMLNRQSLRQLSQRITARYHIMPLDLDDIGSYLRFRLQVAGRVQPLFNEAAIRLISRFSGGIPRLINLVSDRAIEEGEETKSRIIGEDEVKRAINFVSPSSASAHKTRRIGQTEQEQLPVVYNFVIFSLTAAIAVCLGIYLSRLIGPLITPEMPEPVVREELVNNIQAYENQKEFKNKFKSDIRSSNSEEKALADLYRIWGYEGDGVDCKLASLVGLACFKYDGTFDNFVKIDHPAVVRLFDSKLLQFYATVVSIKDNIATVLVAGEPYEFDLPYLKQLWDGHAVILWKELPSGATKLGKNPGSKDLNYMNVALARALKVRQVNYTSYSPQLKEKIKDFQNLVGLAADGIVGSQTLMFLNARGGISMPHLTEEEE